MFRDLATKYVFSPYWKRVFTHYYSNVTWTLLGYIMDPNSLGVSLFKFGDSRELVEKRIIYHSF